MTTKIFWNEEEYNHEKDGKVKNVNGGFMFVPYMYGLDDPIYKIIFIWHVIYSFS